MQTQTDRRGPMRYAAFSETGRIILKMIMTMKSGKQIVGAADQRLKKVKATLSS